MREANGYRDSTGSVIMGNKGNLVLGGNQVIPEMHGDPVNEIPRFMGQPIGGPVYNEAKPTPWIEAQAGTGGRGGGGAEAGGDGGGESMEDRCSMPTSATGWTASVAQQAVLRTGNGPSDGGDLQPRQHVPAARRAGHPMGSGKGSGDRR